MVIFVICSGLACGWRALIWFEIWLTAGTTPEERGWGCEVDGLVMRGDEEAPA